MSDSGSLPILPLGHASLKNNALAEPREGQKNFVFVNEHDRQKRLKVMRACEACRKRKIKCDAVTTNSWPCTKCQKSNLECIPPTADGQSALDGQYPDNSPNDPAESVSGHSNVALSYGWSSNHVSPVQSRQTVQLAEYGYSNPPVDTVSASTHFTPMLQRSFADDQYSTNNTDYANYASYGAMTRPEQAAQVSATIGDQWRHTSPDTENLADALGDLRVNCVSVAPYIANQKSLAEGPAIEEISEVPLPVNSSADSTVRIPPEMMPSDQQATKYFDFFFTNVHPYIPVLNPSYFRSQWALDRNSISPLILEGIFACTSQMLSQPVDRARWIALATRHEESFKDTPRLSTLQGLIILIKAREAVPRRGYYYRSWMSVVNMIAMAKDLGLHEHFEDHQLNQECEPDDSECALKTRIWHTLFQLEVMIGGPQGRTDFAVKPDTIDLNAPRTPQNLDESELQIFQDHTQCIRLVKLVHETTQIYAKLRKRTSEWAADPDFTRHNLNYDNWPRGLPRHLQISYPSNGAAPWIPFHVVGNIHSYYWLGVLMHHRPQLQNASSSFNDSWKHEEMRVCYNAATKICRLQEAVMHGFGLEGLLCMQRGINFSIYCVLTCTMIHLVAITSPDPDLNDTAADFFTRHMRLLEKFSNSWPMEEVRTQIDSLRQAFSADLSKPFELKGNFPYGSPGSSATPPSDSSYNGDFVSPSDMRAPVPFNPDLTPASATSSNSLAPDYGAGQSYPVINAHNLSPQDLPQQAQAAGLQTQWNPSKIFDQWNTAFSFSPPSQPQPQPQQQQPQNVPISSMYNNQQQSQDASWSTYQASALPANQVTIPQMAAQTQQQQYAQQPVSYNSQMPNFITPSMWQDAVIGSYGEGLKKRNHSTSGPSQPYKRVR